MGLIPDWFLNSVVAFGEILPDGSKRVFASGFYYGLLDPEKRTEDGRGNYHVYLVTNRHVVDQVPETAFVRMNVEDSPDFRDFPMSVRTPDGWPTFVNHPDPSIDVAVTTISTKKLAASGLRVAFFQSDDHSATIPQMRERRVIEGDGVFVFGFPLGLVEEPRHAAIVRGGIIARIRDAYEAGKNRFLIDAPVYPGNSGGPVVLRPELLSVMGSASQTDTLLIGIVNGYVPYVDTAFSRQTGDARITFVENSGLSSVFTVDTINEAIAHLKKCHDDWAGRSSPTDPSVESSNG